MPELEDLEKRGFFSRDELRQIARKRTDFEYLLKRRAALREDFLRCGAATCVVAGWNRCNGSVCFLEGVRLGRGPVCSSIPWR